MHNDDMEKISTSSKDQILSFWSWFESKSSEYYHLEENRDELFQDLKEHLEEIEPFLVFEFSSVFPDGTREFVISADGMKDLFPTVKNIVKFAPPLKGWRIVEFKQPHPEIPEITCNNITVKIDDVYIRYEVFESLVGVEFHFRDFKESEEWGIVPFILLDIILGEVDTATCIDWVTKKKLYPNDVSQLTPLRRLPEIVAKVKESKPA